ncbi:hypothetical protein CBOM_03986 [Ceraceosorus bombacis]|uniref:Hydrophobin n=1 Tax=Ceraceosorus bombacis TaxID=401625 RepID=A0A0P1BLI5_9BASI|nr:hypothetical protein CBOM_03986 [Ceraceosorus bombacis]
MKVTVACVALTALICSVSAAPNPRPTALAVRQDSSSASTVAPITSTYDPSQGINGNGCSGNGNVLLCCPDGYRNNVINGETTCVASGGSFTNVEGGLTQIFGSDDVDSQSSSTSTRSSSSPSPSSSSSSSSSASPTPSGKNGNGGATIKSSASVIAIGVVLVGAALV